MEYIRKNIERKINFLECCNNNEDLKVVYQAFLEYLMIYTLSYLWAPLKTTFCQNRHFFK
mgnify:CR=1 FL=1